MTTALWLIVLSGALSIVYGIVTTRSLMAADAGTARMQEISAAVREGAKAYLNRQYTTIAIVGVVIFVIAWLLLGLAAIAVAFTPLVPLGQIGRSLMRLAAADDFDRIVTVAPQATLQEISLDLRPQEIESLELKSDAPLSVRTQQPIEGFALVKVPDVDLAANSPWTWNRTAGDTNPFLGQRAKLEATNASDKPVQLRVRGRLVPEFPQAGILPRTTITPRAVAAHYAVLRLVPRRIAAIAATTTSRWWRTPRGE